MDVELEIETKDVEHFKFPSNTFIYIIDDSSIQRRLLTTQVKQFDVKEDNIFVYGKNEQEIIGLGDMLYEKITKYSEYYHIILCDENLDYKHGEILRYESGSCICENLSKRLDEKNYITIIRSANDSKRDIELYLTRCDGFLPKMMMPTSDLKKNIMNVWSKFFEFEDTTTIKFDFIENVHQIQELFLVEVDELTNRSFEKVNWNSFWSNLHKMKGTVAILFQSPLTKKIIYCIENMKNNCFNAEFDEKWQALCNDLNELKTRLTTES